MKISDFRYFGFSAALFISISGCSSEDVPEVNDFNCQGSRVEAVAGEIENEDDRADFLSDCSEHGSKLISSDDKGW